MPYLLHTTPRHSTAPSGGSWLRAQEFKEAVEAYKICIAAEFHDGRSVDLHHTAAFQQIGLACVCAQASRGPKG